MSSNESGGQVLDGQQNLVLPLTASRDGQRCTLFFSSEYVQWMNSYWLCFIWCLVDLLSLSLEVIFSKEQWKQKLRQNRLAAK